MSAVTPRSPQLSVIVAAWNAAATIEAALASALGQRDVDLECIVVDDASTDDTAAIVERLRADDDRVVLLRQPENGGVSAARNRALEVARGEWLAFLDADDRLFEGGLAAMLRAAAEHDALAVVGQRISTDGVRTWFPVLYEKPDIREPGVKSLAGNPDLLYYAGPVGKLINRSCAAGLTFEGRVLGDQPWILRALLRAGDRIVVIGDVVYEWRRPPRGSSVATITAARVRSARLGAEAVAMAGVAFEVVRAEIERIVDPPARQRLLVTYFERLVLADLAAQLRGAVRRRDPDLDAMLRALAAFIALIPPSVVRANSALVHRELLELPVDAWGKLSPAGRSACAALLLETYRSDPGSARRFPGRLMPAVARLARLPLAVGVPVTVAMTRASRSAARRRRRAAERR